MYGEHDAVETADGTEAWIDGGSTCHRGSRLQFLPGPLPGHTFLWTTVAHTAQHGSFEGLRVERNVLQNVSELWHQHEPFDLRRGSALKCTSSGLDGSSLG